MLHPIGSRDDTEEAEVLCSLLNGATWLALPPESCNGRVRLLGQVQL